MLVDLSITPRLFETTLKVLTARRWHSLPVHEPLSKLFLEQAILKLPIDYIGDLVERAATSASNSAIILSSFTLSHTIDMITKRMMMAEGKTPEFIWSCCALAFRLYNVCGIIPDEVEPVHIALLKLLGSTSKWLPSNCEYKVSGKEVLLNELLLEATNSLLKPDIASKLDRFSLFHNLKQYVLCKRAFPEFIQKHVEESEDYILLFRAYREGVVIDPDLATLRDFVKAPSENHTRNIYRFLNNQAKQAK